MFIAVLFIVYCDVMLFVCFLPSSDLLTIAPQPDGLARGGDWKPHLSVILSNETPSNNAAIISLGDSLSEFTQVWWCGLVGS